MAMKTTQSLSPENRADNKEAASILGLEPETLAQWRYLRKYEDRLPYLKVGRKVFYLKDDLYRFLEACKVGGSNVSDAS